MRWPAPVRSPGARANVRGFSLVEIMVAVVVICVGLLGIAKMQALAVSSTNMARLRAIAAFEAASLASAIHSNRAYWASAAAVADSPIQISIPSGTVTAAGITITPAGFAPGAAADGLCIATSAGVVPACPAPATLAGWDVQRWADHMILTAGASADLLPNLTATITCQGLVQPPSCIIQMWWTEQTGTINSSEQSQAIVDPTIAAASAQNPCPIANACDFYTLYVEP